MVAIDVGLLHHISALGAVENHGAATFGNALLEEEELADGGVVDDGLGGAGGVFLRDFVERATGDTIASIRPASG